MMFFDSPMLNVLVVWLGGGLLGFGLRFLILIGATALADIPERSMWFLALIAAPVWLIGYPVGLALDHFVFKHYTFYAHLGLPRFVGLAVTVVALGAVAAPLYMLALGGGPKKGFWTAVFDAALNLLAAALITTTVFVVLAVVQVAR
jgi:hypothetical protein